MGAATKIVDKRNKIVKIGVEFFGTLHREQNSALTEILQNENGVFVAPPGFGKTVVASAVIAKRKVSTLIIVHTHALLKQWQNAIQKFLHIDAGEISSAKNSATSIVDVAMIQSLKNPENFLYTQIICDECHHIGAFTFENALKKINARYVLGLTATPVRRDGH